MKAERTETPLEKKRELMGWKKSFREWVGATPQCRSCYWAEKVYQDEGKNLHCNLGSFATPPGAICNQFRRFQ